VLRVIRGWSVSLRIRMGNAKRMIADGWLGHETGKDSVQHK